MENLETETERGTFENQFNRKMNQLIKAIESPKGLKLRDVINKLEGMNVQYRTEWVNRIVLEFADDVTMKTLLELKRRKGNSND